MEHIHSITDVTAATFSTPTGDFILLNASGTVSTSGWSGFNLNPRVYVDEPKDGIWDFDFVGDPPQSIALPIILPVAKTIIIGVPEWVQGVRVHSATNDIVSSSISKSTLRTVSPVPMVAATKSSKVYYSKHLATYDDSFQPIGFCSGFGRIKMKKLRHKLTLYIEGPDRDKIVSCMEGSAVAGLIAAIAAAFLTGGGALNAALAAFQSYLLSCLGGAFNVRFENKSRWIEWCT